MIGTFLFSLFLAIPPAQGINYFRCESSGDCAKVYAGCGRYDSVHRRYKELYEAKARKGDTVAFCRAPNATDKEYRAKGEPFCRKMRCRLRLPKLKAEGEL